MKKPILITVICICLLVLIGIVVVATKYSHKEDKVCFQYTPSCIVCEGDTFSRDYNEDVKYIDPFYHPNISKFTVEAIDGYYYKYHWNQQYPEKLITFWVLWFDAFYMSDSFNNSSGFEFCTKWKKEN